MKGSQEFLARRFEPIDLLSERFDSSEVDVRQRIFAFAQPRSASFTLCRLLAAAGWGLPVEYFNLQTMEIYWKRFFGSSFAESTDRESIFRYVAELERRRTRNGVFSAKIMWDNTNRFRTAYSIPSAPVRDAHHIYIRRSDFQTQVVSFMVLQATGVYSFSDQYLLNMQQEEGLTAEERIRRSASYLIKEEQRWFAFFHQHGIQPIFLQYEDVTGDPGEVFEKLSAAFHLPYERDNLQSYAKIERGGRYRNQANQKAELRYLHRDLLHEFADLRNRQFDELTKRYGLPLASIS